MPRRINIPSKEELYDLYILRHYSFAKIAKLLSMGKTTVSRYLRKYKIKARKFGEGKLPFGFVKPSKEEFYELYWDQKLSVKRIAEKLGRSKATIVSWLLQYRIPYRGLADYGTYNKGRSPPNKGKGRVKIKLKHKLTEPEILLKALLEKDGITDGLKEQYWVKFDNFKTRPDFAYPDKKLVIYVDGEVWHGGLHHLGRDIKELKDKEAGIRKQMIRDARVHFALWTNGWAVLRFWQHDIEEQPEWVIEEIKKNLFDKECIKKREEQRREWMEEYKEFLKQQPQSERISFK